MEKSPCICLDFRSLQMVPLSQSTPPWRCGRADKPESGSTTRKASTTCAQDVRSKQRRHGVAVDAEEAGAGAAGRPHCDAPRLAALQPFLSSGEKIAQIAASSA